MPDLRPMEFGEILDGALTLFRRHFGLFLKLSLVVMWLPIPLIVYWRARFVGLQGATPDQTAALLESEIVPFILLGLAVAVIYGIGMLLLTAGSIRVISDSYLGRPPQFGDALRFGVGKIVPLFFVGLGKVLLIALLFLVGGLIVWGIGAALRPMGGGLVVLWGLFGGVGGIWGVIYVACGYIVTTPVVVLVGVDARRPWAAAGTHVRGGPHREFPAGSGAAGGRSGRERAGARGEFRVGRGRHRPSRRAGPDHPLRAHARLLRPAGAPRGLRPAAAQRAAGNSLEPVR
jgi:hypothetical protein